MTSFKPAAVQDRTVLLVSHGGVMEIVLCLENSVSYTNRKMHYRIGDAQIICIE